MDVTWISDMQTTSHRYPAHILPKPDSWDTFISAALNQADLVLHPWGSYVKTKSLCGLMSYGPWKSSWWIDHYLSSTCVMFSEHQLSRNITDVAICMSYIKGMCERKGRTKSLAEHRKWEHLPGLHHIGTLYTHVYLLIYHTWLTDPMILLATDCLGKNFHQTKCIMDAVPM